MLYFTGLLSTTNIITDHNQASILQRVKQYSNRDDEEVWMIIQQQEDTTGD